MKIPGIFSILILASLVLGCGSDSDLATSKPDQNQQTDRPTVSGESGDGEEVRGSKAPSGYEPAVEVLVTSDDDLLPDGCRPRQVAELVTNFFEAFNRGDQERLSRLFLYQ